MLTPPTAFSGSAPARFEGFCPACRRTHALANAADEAVAELARLFAAIGGGTERSSFDRTPGKMVGVMVARDASGERRVVRAFSGTFEGEDAPEGWAPNVWRRGPTAALEAVTLERLAALEGWLSACDVEATRQAWLRTRAGTAEQRRARQVFDLERAREEALREERLRTSRVLSDAMFAAATLTNAKGEVRPLREVFAGKGIPGGTGSCVVPKLLHAANVEGLQPVGIAEAWWGPDLGTRTHGALQPPCARKCEPILGYLLCGRG